MIVATWFLGDAQPAGSRYESGWIFGLAWFPIIAFGFIEYVNAQQIPQSIFGAIQAVFLPYVWVVLFGVWQEQSIPVVLISACVATFIAAFLLHAFALCVSLREAGSSAISEVLIPHLFLYVPTIVLSGMMVKFLWQFEGGSWFYALDLLTAVVQRTVRMYPGLKNFLS